VTVRSSRGSRDPGRVPAVVPVLAAVAGVTYGAWILQFLINPQLDAVNGYVSELSASDQPFHYLFAAADFLAGALITIVGGAVLRRLRPRRSALVGWLALTAFGVFSMGDSLFAMDCAPNSDTTCALRERAGKVTFAHQFHTVTSACVVTAGIVSLIALTVAARRYCRWPVIARWSWPLMVLETVTALATLPLMYLGVLLGVMERVQVSVISLWLFVIAGELYAGRRRQRRAPRSATRTGVARDGSVRASPARERAAPGKAVSKKAVREKATST
jgi:hypothetical protein